MNNYTLPNYAMMLADPVRMPAYIKALKSKIQPGMTVLDLGAGTGGLSLLACTLGAEKVIAVEPNPAIEVARLLASENNFSDRIEFHTTGLESIKTNFKADLIVADLRGRLPFFGNNLRLCKLAKDLFLKPSGLLIPNLDRIYLALASAPNLWLESVKPWSKQDLPFRTKQFEQSLANYFYPINIDQKLLASEAALWCTLDYQNIDQLSFSNTLTLTAQSDLVHGFFAWFDCELTQEVSFSCGPGAKNKVYGSVFFPFESAVKTKSGEAIEIKLSANYIEDDYIWRWQSSLIEKSGIKTALFDQSTFFGLSLSESQLLNYCSKYNS
jgi:protein arginine N-methyltransferase 1